MARPLRIELRDGLYHVASRGIERRDIVEDEHDRQRWLDWLCRTVETYGWRLHAFVLMDNHHHLFVETPEANLSAGMQYLNGSYTGYFNHRYGRAGHLFQGRFKACLIESQGYFLEVSRYIHLNPVRARMVARPEDWLWSSYRGYRQARHAADWMTYARVLGEFGDTANDARRRYCHFVRAGLAHPPQCPWRAAVGGLIVGSESFVQRVRQLLDGRSTDRDVPQLRQLRCRPTLDQIVAAVAEWFGRKAGPWSVGSRSGDIGRAVAASLARRRFGYSAKAVAAALGYRAHGSVAMAMARVEAAGAPLQETLAQLEQRLVTRPRSSPSTIGS